MDEITRKGLYDYLSDLKKSLMKTKYHLDRTEELVDDRSNADMVFKFQDMIVILNDLIDGLWREDEIDG